LLLQIRVHVVHRGRTSRRVFQKVVFEPSQPGRHAVFAELPVQPERAVTREDEVILGPQPHAIILGPRDPRHDDPRVLHEVVHVSAAMIVLAALEVTLPRQLEHHVTGQVLYKIRDHSTSPAIRRRPHP
jgi:hypothetical protein